MRSLVNTFFFALVVVPIQGGLGLLLALIVNQRTAGVNIFRTIYFMPVVVSMVVVSILWRFIYDGQNGLLNNLLGFITFGAFEPVDWLGNPSTAMPAIMSCRSGKGLAFIWSSGWPDCKLFPLHLYEAADVDGANTWQQFRYVTWPGLRNTAVFVLVTITIAGFWAFHPDRCDDPGRPSGLDHHRYLPDGPERLRETRYRRRLGDFSSFLHFGADRVADPALRDPGGT